MVKLNKIYTRTGDGGSAGLVDGSRVSKSSLRMTAIGEVDEANAAIGVAIAALEPIDVGASLLAIQNDLFDLGADVATPGEVEGRLRIVASQVERLEREIDAMNRSLEPLDQLHPAERFGGGRGAAPRPRRRPPRRARRGRAERGRAAQSAAARLSQSPVGPSVRRRSTSSPRQKAGRALAARRDPSLTAPGTKPATDRCHRFRTATGGS